MVTHLIFRSALQSRNTPAVHSRRLPRLQITAEPASIRTPRPKHSHYYRGLSIECLSPVRLVAAQLAASIKHKWTDQDRAWKLYTLCTAK